MIWDHEQRRYEDEDGRPLTAAEIRKSINEYIAAEQEDVKRQSAKLLSGSITVAKFFDFMRQKITTWHSVSGVVAYGGEDEMNAERWARINKKILSELEYLNAFEEQAEDSFDAVDAIADRVTDATIKEVEQWQPTAVN